MNFIDAALANSNNLSNDDFLQAMADIYNDDESFWNLVRNYIGKNRIQQKS